MREGEDLGIAHSASYLAHPVLHFPYRPLMGSLGSRELLRLICANCAIHLRRFKAGRRAPDGNDPVAGEGRRGCGCGGIVARLGPIG